MQCLRRFSRCSRTVTSPNSTNLGALTWLQARNYLLDFKTNEPFQPRPGRSPQYCNTPLDAVRGIHSGDRIFIHGMASTPECLINALCQHAEEHNKRNIELVHLLTSGPAPQVSGRYKKHFTDTSLFISNNVRQAVNDGRANFVPIFLSEIPLLFVSPNYRLDAAFLHVSPPDASGFCSLGVNVDCARAAAAGARLLIGAINRHQPRVMGDGHVHISQFDYVVEHHTPLPKLSDIQTHEAEKPRLAKIGKIIADELVEDGACLQIGIGEIPQNVLKNLVNHRDLGVHTEMFGDDILHLFEAGCITNSKKVQHPGKTVGSFVMGHKAYDFIEDNPGVILCETNYVNDIANICQNPNVVAINAALEIDLTGQVVADSIGLNMYSGVGGQVDFIRGAAVSRGGKPVIAMTSTTHRGESKIVPWIREGAGVVTTRAHVWYVVTEFGCVKVFGKSLKERAELLISIAHPKYRDWLTEEARIRFNYHWNPDSIPVPL